MAPYTPSSVLSCSGRRHGVGVEGRRSRIGMKLGDSTIRISQCGKCCTNFSHYEPSVCGRLKLIENQTASSRDDADPRSLRFSPEPSRVEEKGATAGSEAISFPPSQLQRQ